MNIKSERGQGEMAIVILLAIVAIALLFIGMAANQRGMQAGANVIGDTVGNAIDNAAAVETYVAWKGTQMLQPNKHAVERHGADAWAAVDCYNRNGAFHVMSTRFDGIHLLCKDDDGSIRDVILKQRGKTNEFDFDNAFTPQNGKLQQVLEWIGRKTGAGKFTMPENSVIYIDDIAP